MVASNMSQSPVLLLASKLNIPVSISSSSNQHQDGKSEAWHVSICVFDREYSCGRDGITISKIKQQPPESIIIGYTNTTCEELNNYVKNLKGWKKRNYDVLNNNCQHFAQLILRFLGIKKLIPKHFTNLPKVLRSAL
ncbi:hypothetical protein ILUMI_09415 [Ignelater luminosus]|uniref:PPPDE domain-containing protein n=1 Tax=Ignelater luminosus TaxID=2038154 RepID=A0A8K0GF28_IGNLU|nr:hypothetical protein ILUMI_09415 [Ignelater luminosus]